MLGPEPSPSVVSYHPAIGSHADGMRVVREHGLSVKRMAILVRSLHVVIPRSIPEPHRSADDQCDYDDEAENEPHQSTRYQELIELLNVEFIAPYECA